MNQLNKWYKCKIEHLINKEIHKFEFPETPFDSFTMATAHFVKQALSSAFCGEIIKVEVVLISNQQEQ